MKKFFFCILTAMFAATALFAQTTEEIIARMDEQTERFTPEGFSMIMEIRLPIIGTIGTTAYILGDKYKLVSEIKGDMLMYWSDKVTDWEYDASKNEVTITNANPSEESQAESNVKMLKGVTDGYDVRLRSETDEVWNIRCTKSKTNKEKDDPRTMDLVVAKGSYMPVSLKSTLKGVTVTLRNFAVGITEEEVTFDPAKFTNAKIIDKR
jgi:outer membrane lipoprotein-sorting protein